MKRAETEGKCSYCGELVKKTAKSISKHISSCEVKIQDKPDAQSNELHTIAIIDNQYAPDYWMVLKLKNKTTFFINNSS